MPELPQIEPQGQVKPAGVAPVEPGQGPARVATAIQDTSEKAAAVYQKIVSIDRYNQFHQADAEMIVGQAGIDKESRTIADPEGRVAFVQKANENLIKRLTAAYPHAGPELGPQLLQRGAENVRQATNLSIVLAHGNAVENMATMSKTTQEAFSVALDDRDAQQVLANGHKVINNYVANGAISQGEAEHAHFELEYGAHLAAFNHVVDTPGGALKVMQAHVGDPKTTWEYNGQKMNLTAEDFLTVQSRAAREENRQNDTAEDQHKSMVNQINQGIMDKTIPDAAYQWAYKHGFVSPTWQKYHDGHAAFDEGGISGAMGQLEHMNGSSTSEYDHWYANYALKEAPYHSPAENSAVRAEYQAMKTDAGTDEGMAKQKILADVNRSIERAHPRAFGSMPDLKARAQMQYEKSYAKATIMGMKSVPEAQKWADEHVPKIAAKHTPYVAPSAPGLSGHSTDILSKLPPLPGAK